LRKNNTGTNNEEDSSVWLGGFSFLIGIIIYITIYILYDSDDERICLNKKIRVQMRCIDVYTAGEKTGWKRINCV
jgi:hypothetical protein